MGANKTGREIVLRLSIVYFAIVLFAALIVVRIFYLQIFEHEKWSNANMMSQKDIIIEAERGNIYASDGRILATSIPYYEIRMDMKCPEVTKALFNQKIDSLSLCLSRLFRDDSPSGYRRKLVNARYRGDRYFLIQRKVDYLQLKELKKFPIFRLGQYKGGFIIIQENRRIQPFNVANRTIGYQGKGGANVGVEGAFEEYLRGENGVRLVQRIAGNYWMPVNDGNQVEPKNGDDVITTIDINVQDVAQQALKAQLQKHSASHGCAVLMEVKTGDIRAIVNLKRDSQGVYTEQYNYAIGERTEPGSTFKLPVLMAAFEDGFVDLDDIIHTGNGTVRYHDHEVKDTKEEGYGSITVKQVFEYSSNVGVSKIITQYYGNKEERFVNRLDRMGLTKPLDIDIKGERPPYIKFPSDPLWSGISLPQMSYGYEVEQTPLQILTFYNAVANNGKMMKPRLVKEIRNHGKLVDRFGTEVINPSICSKSTIEKAKSMLEGVVENGTAQNLKSSNYKIAGKTGTAQIANTKYGYKYQSRISYQASFVGYFPADNPKYSCIVVVNAPSSGVYYGNLVAGQVFKEIADKVYSTTLDLHEYNKLSSDDHAQNIPYSKNGHRNEIEYVLDELNVPLRDLGVTSDWISTQRKETSIQLNNRKVTDNLVPDVKGMGAKDAIYLLENMGLYVIIDGRGAVSDQSIPAGTRVRQGERIRIILKS